jgi:hypothetical protein
MANPEVDSESQVSGLKHHGYILQSHLSLCPQSGTKTGLDFKAANSWSRPKGGADQYCSAPQISAIEAVADFFNEIEKFPCVRSSDKVWGWTMTVSPLTGI